MFEFEFLYDEMIFELSFIELIEMAQSHLLIPALTL